MLRSFVAVAAYAVALLADHVAQGYRINSKKLMTTSSSVLSKHRARSVVHSVDMEPADNGSQLEQGAEENESTLEAKRSSAPNAVMVEQAVNASAGSEETRAWEPQGILVKMGYLRSKAILHIAAYFLPTAMVQNMPAMDGVKIFDVPVTSGPSFVSTLWDTPVGKVVCIGVPVGAVVTLAFMVKLYNSILAARAKPSVEGDDDNVMSALGDFVGLAVPMLLGSFLFMLNEMTNTIVLGQKGTPVELASLGLVTSLLNCALLTVGMGLQNVMDTTVSQAYGAGERALCLTYMQQCRFLVLCLAVVVAPLFFFSESLLLLVGQEAEVAAQTSLPAKLFWVGGFFNQTSLITFFFLKNIGDLSTIWMFAAGNVVHLTCAIVCAGYLEMGVFGIGIAMVCQNITLACCLQYYLVNKSPVKDFPLEQKLFVTSESLQGLGNYIVLGIPSVLSSCCESWFWEMNTVIIGWLGAVSLAAHTSSQSLIATLLTVCFCTSGAGTTLVSRALGSGRPRAARALSFWSIFTIWFMWVVVATVLFTFDHSLARLFNSNPTVLNIVYTLMHIQALGGICNCAQMIAGSVLKAMLKHRLVAIIQSVNYYIVALPIGYYMAFSCKMGVVGVYTGFGVGMTLSMVTLIGAVSNVDYDLVTEDTKKRLAKDAGRQAKEI